MKRGKSLKRSHRNGIAVPTREPIPYISPGRPEHIDDLVLSSAQVQRRSVAGEDAAVLREALAGKIPTLAEEWERKRTPRRRAVSPATPAQRARAKAMGCVVTGAQEGVDPAHLIARGFTTVGQDEPLAVVGLRRDLHRRYDAGELDLLPYLTGRHDDAVAFAVQRVGLITALERITNAKWMPVPHYYVGPEVRF